mmetsp:Transcript_11434/g.29519  ORF Transcript_11434/g.29519 Transcript_11434/m.29519 type:complete len:215 (-) Transcript_11434:125-769(-)
MRPRTGTRPPAGSHQRTRPKFRYLSNKHRGQWNGRQGPQAELAVLANLVAGCLVLLANARASAQSPDKRRATTHRYRHHLLQAAPRQLCLLGNSIWCTHLRCQPPKSLELHSNSRKQRLGVGEREQGPQRHNLHHEPLQQRRQPWGREVRHFWSPRLGCDRWNIPERTAGRKPNPHRRNLDPSMLQCSSRWDRCAKPLSRDPRCCPARASNGFR